MSARKLENHAKEAHDLKSALMRIKTFRKMVAKGFDFNSEDGQAYFTQLDAGIELLEKELSNYIKSKKNSDGRG